MSLHDMFDAVDHGVNVAYNADLAPLIGVAGVLIALAFGLWAFKLVSIAATEVIKEVAGGFKAWIK